MSKKVVRKSVKKKKETRTKKGTVQISPIKNQLLVKYSDYFIKNGSASFPFFLDRISLPFSPDLRQSFRHVIAFFPFCFSHRKFFALYILK